MTDSYFFKYFLFAFLIAGVLFSIQPKKLYGSTEEFINPDKNITINNLNFSESLKKIEREFNIQIKIKGHFPKIKKQLSFPKKDINSALIHLLRNFNIKNYAIMESLGQQITIFTFQTHQDPTSTAESYENLTSREDAISGLLLAGSPDDTPGGDDSRNQKPSQKAIKRLLEAGSPDENNAANASLNNNTGTTNPKGKKEAINQLIEAGSPDDDNNRAKNNSPEGLIAREEAIRRLKEAGSPDGNISSNKGASQEALRGLLEAGSPDGAGTY